MSGIYTQMKIFHYKEKIDSLPEFEKKILPPVHVRIKPTNVCNHNCWYCAYRADNLQLGKDMKIKDYIPEHKMMEIIDDFEHLGVKAVTFSGGGDPFCYPYIIKAVRKLHKAGIKFACLTNGSRLQGEVAEVFAKKATWIRISIDGWDNESYSEYRGVAPEEFNRVIRNLENFSKLRPKCYLGVCIIADQKNAAKLYGLISTLKDSGVRSVKIAPCIVSNDGKENNMYHEPIFSLVKKQVNTAIENLSDRTFEIFDSYHTQLNTFQKNYKWCPYLQILPVIGADSNVYSCHDKAYNLDNGMLGSLKGQRFKDLWFSNKRIFFSIDPSMHCNHHCVVDNHNRMLLEYLNVNPEHGMFV
jgi:MoaA/NifB/PqqE/SkfB family radical SAM enzyme